MSGLKGGWLGRGEGGWGEGEGWLKEKRII